MKKLLVTAIGAAVAFGAFADAVRFEESTPGSITNLEQLPGGTKFWSEPAGATNTYAIGAAGTVSAPLSIASALAAPTNEAPTQALDIKTTFGKPLSLNAVSGGTPMDINDGLYFDSLVKFTVCDADQNTAYAAYDDAKIVMWLEQTEDESKTNLIVQAGYLSWDNAEGKYVSTPTNYVCALPGSFNIDAWHRVTIKAIADITTGYGIPGFAIYLDQSGDTVTQFINAGTAAMWDGETLESELTEAAAYLYGNGRKALFPSRKLGSGQDLTSVGFDGTGSITDLIFTENGPAFAQDYVAPKASVQIGDVAAKEYGSLAEAVAAVSGLTDGQTATLKLIKGVTLEEPLTINADFGRVIIDFAGNVWTNALTDAAITNNAAELVITNSVGNGGIYCTDRADGVAIYNNGGLAIYGGTINGLFGIGDNSSIEIFGGSFFDSGVEDYLVDGKVLKENTETDLFDVVDKPNTWAGLLGEAVDGAYTIDDADDVLALQNGVLAGLATAGETFKQTANIDMTGVTDFWGIGWFTSSDSKDASITASGDIPFAGTYDGQGYTISNVTIVRHNYAGVFNNVSGTVKNLTVQDIGFSGTCSEWGGAIVGNAQGSALLENLTSAGTVWGDTANHNVAGTVVRVQNTVTIRGCVNNAPITSISRRLGGIVAFTGNTAPTGTITIDSCTNNAALTVNTGTNAGDRGIGGIISRPESVADGLLIRNCANFGTLTNNGVPAKVGGIAGELNSQNYVDDGGNTFLASLGPVGNYNSKTVTGLAYAVESTINNEAYLTTVKAADIAKGGTYTLLTDIAASETPVITLDDAGDSITFKLNGHQFLGTVAVDHDGVTAEAQSDEQAGTITYAAAITDQWAYRLGNPVNGAYEIDNLAELKAFQTGVAVPLATAGVTFKLTDDIALEEAWEGIGVKGGKDLVNGSGTNIPAYEAGAFCGTFDGQNHTISNFQMENDTDYGGFFNSVNGATISNLKITYKEDKLCANSSSTGGDTGATFVGVARNSTLQNLTALAGTVTTVSASKDMAGIVGYLMAGSTVESCTNELNVASLKSKRKSGGIALITQEGTGTATIRNCKNSGTATAADGNWGAIVGYVGTNTTIECCENTAAVRMLTLQSGSVTMQGTNKGNATVLSSNKAIDGLNFATVDGNVATFVADNALAAGNTYKVMAPNATATFEFAEAGTIAFDTALATPTYAITAASGLTLTDATEGTVTTYTAVKPSGIDPADNTPVPVEASSESEATNKVVVVVPAAVAAVGVTAEAYKANFDFTATANGDGTFNVSIKDIKEEVKTAVATTAEAIVSGTEATGTVTVPAGLYYKVTTYETLGGTPTVAIEPTLSTGAASSSIAKPGDSQGFIKVEIATTATELAD